MSEKSYLSSGSAAERSVVRRLAVVGIAGNIVLSAFKLFAGMYGQSAAMVSDAVHSFSDVLATLAAYLGVIISRKPADKEHPYGHERAECLASMLLAAILIATGFGIGKSGVDSIMSGSYAAVPSRIALAAAVISIVSKEAMYWYTLRYAKLLNSEAFIADAWHHRSDALSSVGSLIGIAGAMAGYPMCDAAAAALICVFILKAGWDVLRRAADNMVDTSCDEKYEKRMAEFISSRKDVICVDMIRTRMFGSRIYVDLEIEVDGNKTLREAHEVAESVHDSIESNFTDVKHIMIHVNPA